MPSTNRPSPLGLFDEGESRPSDSVGAVVEAAPQASADARQETRPELSVIVPARNEQDVIGECLRSLLAQDDTRAFALGRDWELMVVNDGSTDRTRAIAEEVLAGRAGCAVVDAPELDVRAFTGKSNACWFGAHEAKGKWLLFTDADTVHEQGDLPRALHEAGKHHASLLSYSPQQIVGGVVQRMLMPLVFSELASVYPTVEVNDPDKRTAAANGQFLMVEREAYFAVGGHRAVGRSVLEDVELAHNVKRAFAKKGRGLRFRYAPDALSTRMYRGTADMLEGWTKNLALLFPHALKLAAWRVLDMGLLLLPLLLWLLPYLVLWQQAAVLVIWLRTVFRFYHRVARSHMGFANCALSVLGLPLLVVLLIRSWMQHKIVHQVAWKGRAYRT